jgi:tRNA-2-methylthio-N6-dimethylallyladenosine synthase
MSAVADVPGVERVRFTSPHPKDFPQELLRVISTHPNVCKHIHLPLQSANNRILDLMNRTYTIEQFAGLVEEMRSRIPGVALSTDIIVGFPTESDAEFEETVRAMETFRFDFAFIFKYSERKGTGAARTLEDDVTPDTKTERIVRLVELQKEITGEINQALVGQTFEVLVDEASPKDPGCLVGRTDTFKPVVFPAGNASAGDLVEVRIEKSRGARLFGRQLGGGRDRSTRSAFVADCIGCLGAVDGIG